MWYNCNFNLEDCIMSSECIAESQDDTMKTMELPDGAEVIAVTVGRIQQQELSFEELCLKESRRPWPRFKAWVFGKLGIRPAISCVDVPSAPCNAKTVYEIVKEAEERWSHERLTEALDAMRLDELKRTK
jgi:hypothetical protein